MKMRKQDAISLFGTPRALASALGVTPQAIYQWPDKISQEQADRVTGAAVRLGKVRAGDQSGIREQKRARA